MKKSKFSEEQILFALRQAEAGLAVEDICRKLGAGGWRGTAGFRLTMRSP